MTPKRIRLSRKKGWRLPAGAINCARPGPWGNTVNWQDFLDIADGERDAKRIAQRAFNVELRGAASMAHLRQRLPELRDHDLACWCRLCFTHRDGLPLGVTCDDCDPCHVDVLLREANR